MARTTATRRLPQRHNESLDDFFPREDEPRRMACSLGGEADFQHDLDAVEDFGSEFDTIEEDRGMW